VRLPAGISRIAVISGGAALLGLLVGLGLAAAGWHGGSRPTGWHDDPVQVAAGHVVYDAHCAACHGVHLEGQPRWWTPGPDGLLPAPPHDETGHSWQHSDAELYDVVAHSLAHVAPPDYRSNMPAFEGALDDGEIHAVIAFIKSTWPEGVRGYQAARNPDGPKLGDLAGDWRFPPSCDLRFGERPAPPGG
jgi:mono/diheme cytochrome c family protein